LFRRRLQQGIDHAVAWSAIEHPQKDAQNDAHNYHRHERKIEAEAFTLNDDIAGQSAKTKLAQQRPQQAGGEDCKSEDDQKP
jgi:hypothetical protein